MSIKILHDLRHSLGPAIDQGDRATCFAIATTSAHEIAIPLRDPLSAEYLFYQAVRRSADQDPCRGINLLELKAALSEDGQPLNDHWPYSPTVGKSRELPTPPSKPPAKLWYGAAKVSMTIQVDSVHANLAEGCPTIVGFTATKAFHRPDSEGVIDSNPRSQKTGQHVVLAVGSGTRAGSRFLLLRNSWGTGWGLNGHGWVDDEYLERQALFFSNVEHLHD